MRRTLYVGNLTATSPGLGDARGLTIQITRRREFLRDLRQRHGVSQRSLARRAGASQSWISYIERGRVSPTEPALRRVLL